jgi:hypothetical protein
MDVFDICSASLQLQSLPAPSKHLLEKSDYLGSATETLKASMMVARTPSMAASSRPERAEAQPARGHLDPSLQRLVNQRKKKPARKTEQATG